MCVKNAAQYSLVVATSIYASHKTPTTLNFETKKS